MSKFGRQSIYEGLGGGRTTQLKWLTLADKLRKKKKREKDKEGHNSNVNK